MDRRHPIAGADGTLTAPVDSGGHPKRWPDPGPGSRAAAIKISRCPTPRDARSRSAAGPQTGGARRPPADRRLRRPLRPAARRAALHRVPLSGARAFGRDLGRADRGALRHARNLPRPPPHPRPRRRVLVPVEVPVPEPVGVRGARAVLGAVRGALRGRRAPPEGARGDRARARNPRAHRRGPLQPRNRRTALRQREHGQDPLEPALRQAGGPAADPGGPFSDERRASSPEGTLTRKHEIGRESPRTARNHPNG